MVAHQFLGWPPASARGGGRVEGCSGSMVARSHGCSGSWLLRIMVAHFRLAGPRSSRQGPPQWPYDHRTTTMQIHGLQITTKQREISRLNKHVAGALGIGTAQGGAAQTEYSKSQNMGNRAHTSAPSVGGGTQCATTNKGNITRSPRNARTAFAALKALS